MLLTGPATRFSAESRGNLEVAERLGVPVHRRPSQAQLRRTLRGAEVVIDALFGTGFRGAPRPAAATLIESINAAGRPVVALDIPSGVDASDGTVAGAAVAAELTVAFHGPKLGLIVAPGSGLCRCRGRGRHRHPAAAGVTHLVGAGHALADRPGTPQAPWDVEVRGRIGAGGGRIRRHVGGAAAGGACGAAGGGGHRLGGGAGIGGRSGRRRAARADGARPSRRSRAGRPGGGAGGRPRPGPQRRGAGNGSPPRAAAPWPAGDRCRRAVRARRQARHDGAAADACRADAA